MEVQDAIRKRQSIRAFLEKDVDIKTIRCLLDIAKWAPSGTNIQPWQVCVVKGDTKRKITERIVQTYQEGTPSNDDYRYYPKTWREPYLSRRKKCGLQLYSALDIKREDKERRKEQWIRNYQSFGAPVTLFFFIDPDLEKGSYLDYGMFLQSIMVGALGEGLGTCPQAALGEYPSIVKEVLGVDSEKVLLCGMSVGYVDWDHPANQYRTEREDLDQFTHFFD